jgi:fructokinase
MRLGIDLGGTKIEIIALDETGRERYRRRTATPRGSYEGTLTVIADLVRAAERDAGTRGTVGIAMPGAISPATGLVKNANSTWLNGRRLQADVETLLDRPVRLTNDANCFALSEATDGAGAGVDVVFGVIAGTGTGGGVVVHGKVCTGPNAIAGEWGHNPLPWPDDDERPGPACYCGKRGCIETFLSGPGMTADHQRAAGVRLDPRAIVERAATGDAACEATLARYEGRMARALATVINILDPDVIVLGGGMSNIDRLYEGVPRRLPKYVFSDHVTTRLLRPVHGDSSGVRGAAWMGGVEDGK